jgi:hypothetical protein
MGKIAENAQGVSTDWAARLLKSHAVGPAIADSLRDS